MSRKNNKKKTRKKTGFPKMLENRPKTITRFPQAVKPVEQDPEQIYIAVPTTGGKIHVSMLGFLNTIMACNHSDKAPWKFNMSITSDKRPVEYARNVLCGLFLRSDCEKMYFIDSDMIPPENALNLLDVDADIVIGQAFKFDHAAKDGSRMEAIKLCAFHYNEGAHVFEPVVPDEGEQIVPVSGGGTACMVIKRRVLEDPRMHLDPEYQGNDGSVRNLAGETDREEWAPAIFRTKTKPNGEILRGEDLDFCRRAQLLGYSVVCHLGVRFGHAKNIDLNEAVNLVNRVAMSVLKDRTTPVSGYVSGGVPITRREHA